jgi:hypothetical protein
MEKTILALEPNLDAARRLLEKHPTAIIAKSADEAIFKLSRGDYKALLVRSYTGLEGDEEKFDTYEQFENRDCSRKLIEWILVYYPRIKRIWLHGEDFHEIAQERQMLQGGGYPSIYMAFEQFLTFDNA